MRHITYMGQLYRLTESNYRKVLQAIVAGKDFSYDDFGKCLGNVENFTDLSVEWAQSLLQSFNEERRKS